MSQTIVFNRIAIIGLGLIGSSIARAAYEYKLAKHIVGYDRNEISLAYARKHGFIDTAETDPAVAVTECDLIILATPASTLAALTQAIAPQLQPGAIVMDVCSVKQAAIVAIATHLPAGVEFMPAHPIAGSEHSGVIAGRADLFDKKRIIVTPEIEKENEVFQKIVVFWKGMGARVEAMPAHVHDQIYAYVSHLPQLLAFASSVLFEDEEHDADNDVLNKFLRLANSNPEMWVPIFLLNKDNVLKALDRYIDVLIHINSELADAPLETPPEADEKLARYALFPRIAASCLVTTVMETERQAGFSFARYSGAGFADFTYPASQPPEGDIESISNQYKAVSGLLSTYCARLREFRIAIASDNADKTEKVIANV